MAIGAVKWIIDAKSHGFITPGGEEVKIFSPNRETQSGTAPAHKKTTA
ncbi:MAG: hypothetical protein HZA59_15365 [Hydrogenophilales bacterium]|nr:hypothetical protein [Hydrogenophilales bacterium]